MQRANNLLGPLYPWLWARPRTDPFHVQPSPQSIPTLWFLCRPDLVTYKVMRPNSRSRCSWVKSVVRRTNVLWIYGKDAHYLIDKLDLIYVDRSHYLTDKPDLAHVERSGQGKTHPDFFKQETKTIAYANYTRVSRFKQIIMNLLLKFLSTSKRIHKFLYYLQQSHLQHWPSIILKYHEYYKFYWPTPFLST